MYFLAYHDTRPAITNSMHLYSGYYSNDIVNHHGHLHIQGNIVHKPKSLQVEFDNFIVAFCPFTYITDFAATNTVKYTND